MDHFAWVLWVILGVVLIIAEIFTFGFVLFWFGIGALAAGMTAWLGFGYGPQFLVFAIASVALTAMSRSIFAQYYSHGDADMIKTGVDTLPGQVGTVSIKSHGALNEGAVKVYGSTWTAYPADGSTPLIEGEKVVVDRVEGSSIYVRPVSDKRELPGWRDEEHPKN
jgi:membrane protein implicated in regulation of membrane protease activity